jgi:hypothetical protein
MTKTIIQKDPNTPVSIEINKRLVDEGIGMIISSLLFVGLVVLGILGKNLKKSIDTVVDNLDKKQGKRVEYEEIESINTLLYGLLYTYKPVRVFILEFHNGKVTGNGKSYEKVSVTYEVAEIGYKKIAGLIQNIPKPLIIEDLIRLKNEGIIVLKQSENSSPLLIEGNEVAVIGMLDLSNIENGVIGMAFKERDYKPIDTKEFTKIKRRINQILE